MIEIKCNQLKCKQRNVLVFQWTSWENFKMMEGIDGLFKEINCKKSPDFDDENSDGKCVILDVGGDRFVASRKHLERFPSTR